MDNQNRLDFEAGAEARLAKESPLENPHFAGDSERFNSWSDGWIYQEIEKLGDKSSLWRDVRIFDRSHGQGVLGITASWGR